MNANSYIEIRRNRAGQDRAFIVGSRVRVQDIYVEAEVHGRTPDEIAAAYPQLSLAKVHAALAFYFDHQEAIKAEIRQDRELVAEARARTGPGPLEEKLTGKEAESDSVSP